MDCHLIGSLIELFGAADVSKDGNYIVYGIHDVNYDKYAHGALHKMTF